MTSLLPQGWTHMYKDKRGDDSWQWWQVSYHRVGLICKREMRWQLPIMMTSLLPQGWPHNGNGTRRWAWAWACTTYDCMMMMNCFIGALTRRISMPMCRDVTAHNVYHYEWLHMMILMLDILVYIWDGICNYTFVHRYGWMMQGDFQYVLLLSYIICIYE